MEKSTSLGALAKGLLLFHAKVDNVKKDSTNPFFKNKYASLSAILEAVKVPLIESGLVFSQFPTGQHELTSILIHAESGEYIQDTFLMKPTKDDPQGLGSSITYQRRYAIGAILGINIDDDDDANLASSKQKPGKLGPGIKSDSEKKADPNDITGRIPEDIPEDFMKWEEKRDKAIGTLLFLHKEDDITRFAGDLDVSIRKDTTFRKAAKKRIDEVNKVPV